MENDILLIGNYSVGVDVFDGQRLKVRLYYDLLIRCGFSVELVDLMQIKKHPIKLFMQIKNGIKKCKTILLICAYGGAKVLIPLINKLNKGKKRFVYSVVGISLLHYPLDGQSQDVSLDFFENNNFSNVKKAKKWMIKSLKRIDLILVETDTLAKAYRSYFELENVVTLTNFRTNTHFSDKKNHKIVFLSRVCEQKGIFDLLGAVINLNSKGENIFLDIYGPLQMSGQEKLMFDELIKHKHINYCGEANPNSVIKIISTYELFVFPTRYLGEGTPGVLVESLLAGTPVLCSNFLQAKDILKDGYDSVFFEMFNKNELEAKISKIMGDDMIAARLKNNARISSRRYLFESNKKKFIRYIVGDSK